MEQLKMSVIDKAIYHDQTQNKEIQKLTNRITHFFVNQPVNTYQCIKIGNCYGHTRKGPEGIKNPAN